VSQPQFISFFFHSLHQYASSSASDGVLLFSQCFHGGPSDNISYLTSHTDRTESALPWTLCGITFLLIPISQRISLSGKPSAESSTRPNIFRSAASLPSVARFCLITGEDDVRYSKTINAVMHLKGGRRAIIANDDYLILIHDY
jgi:hypothetical protein